MHPPNLITVEISNNYVDSHEILRQNKFTDEEINKILLKFNSKKAPYVGIKALSKGIISVGFYGSRTKDRLLLDEIIIN